MTADSILSVAEFLELYELHRDDYGWIDVRSEGEFAKSSFPSFRNLPILSNLERHEVGLTYRQHGQTEAISLGHRLVDPKREERVRLWKEAASGSAVMICWRGGMRSQIAADWLRQTGTRVRSVQGGSKAIRNELLRAFTSLPEFLIVSGLTGSGKTELLEMLDLSKIDLEKLANHRGSSFGNLIGSPQPSQASFENRLCLELRKTRRESPSRVLMEDESISIGSCFLSLEMKLQMNASPCIFVESPVEGRARRIYAEYVEKPLSLHPIEKVCEAMLDSLIRIQRKLGGLEANRLHSMIREAFQKSSTRSAQEEHHIDWISRLLEVYYDPMYRYGFDKRLDSGRKIQFRGTLGECKEWLQKKFV